jgi:two-component system, OmpR family, sensor histidine kinase TctE
MRAPSLLRALVVRLTIVVVLGLAGSYLVLYFEFREGLWGLEGQSIAVQVQNLRASIVSGRARRVSSCRRPCESSTPSRIP